MWLLLSIFIFRHGTDLKNMERLFKIWNGLGPIWNVVYFRAWNVLGPIWNAVFSHGTNMERYGTPFNRAWNALAKTWNVDCLAFKSD